MIEFKLPELGENIEQGDLVRLMIAPGASVSAGQAVMELETDKAVVEVPSSVNGTVQEIRVKEGEKIRVGQVIFTVENGTGAKAAAESSPEKRATAPSRGEVAVQPDHGKQGRPASSAREGGPSAPPPAPAAATAATAAPKKQEQAQGQATAPPAKSSPAGAGASEFKLPELGENISQGDLVRLMIAPGSKVAEGQPVMELETDKAVVEVPSSVGGVVKEIKVKEGEKIKVGQVIFTLEGGAAQPERSRPRTAPVEHVSGQHGARLAFQAAIRAEGKTEEQALPPDQPREAIPAFSMPVQLGKVAGTEHRQPIPAAPHVRRLAREIGVDIYEVKGTGPGGRISEDDVKSFAKAKLSAAASAVQAPPAGQFAAPKLPDFAKWGKIERVSIRGVRRKTAEHLAAAWNTIPHVTQHDRADITRLEELRRQFAGKAESAGGKLTITAIAVKVIASALRVFPQFAASVDVRANEIVYKKYCHIGVAVDTDRGLLVPVIRDADRKNIIELAGELGRLAEKARAKKLAPDEMEGGVFTITNLGGIGGTSFSPIVNAPEVAILGISRSSMEPVYANGLFSPCLMLPLSLSYDHRLIDGADAARFLRWVVEALEQPFLLSLEG